MDDATSVSSHEDHHPNKSKPIATKKKKSRKGSASQRIFFSVVRFVFLDLVVLAPLVVFCSLELVQKVRDNYLLKQMELQHWNDERRMAEGSYMHRECEPDSITAHDTPEIMIDPAAGTQAALEKMMIHGASVYPNLLKPETAKELREFIVTENKRTTDIIPVIEQKNRWSFPIQVDQHPSVAKALKEILSKDYLVNAIEAIMGPNPAVIEFTGITSAYGAGVQRMHQDVIPESSAAKFNRNYIPSYSLFIPLQNTTKAMGATEICPGTHQFSAGCNEVCEVDAFHASGSADNWPMGFGALVNQQTTHRGPAHVGKGQPERVLFILTFAPRPRLGEKQVESRILGSGGSYSMHWSQWGHTLKDYADPERRMSFGWRHLKSLGIYKPWGHDWGWDYVTVSSQRMLHEELGFTAEDFQDTYKKGKFDWIPKSLHGKVVKTDDAVEAWTTFLSDTVANVKDFARTWYFTLLGTYLAVILGGNSMLHATGFIDNAPARAFQCIRRVALTHGVVVFFSFLYYRSVERGSWARNIKQGMQYRAFSDYLGPEFPGTLPNKYDVLIFDDLQSPYLASTAFVYDYTHPGSYRWMNMTKAYSGNFASLPSAMRSHLCKDMVEWQQSEHKSRILVKNHVNEWATAPDDVAERICQKALLNRDHKLKSYAIKWIDFLVSEIRFGFWRESSMNRKYMEQTLIRLQDKVIGFEWQTTNKTDVLYNAQENRSRPPFVLGSMGIPLSQESLKHPKRTAVPPRPQPEEPYEGAWLQEGDIVEANYASYTGEFYRARIETPIADSGTWDVMYDDGEDGLGLCATCVRPFVPYQVGEVCDWTDRETNFVPCTVTAVTGEDSYEIQLDDGRKLEDVSASNLRRMLGGGNMKGNAFVLNVGTRVRAQFPGEDSGQLFPAVIHAIVGKDLYAVAYDDGDFAESVPESMIYAA